MATNKQWATGGSVFLALLIGSKILRLASMKTNEPLAPLESTVAADSSAFATLPAEFQSTLRSRLDAKELEVLLRLTAERNWRFTNELKWDDRSKWQRNMAYFLNEAAASRAKAAKFSEAEKVLSLTLKVIPDKSRANDSSAALVEELHNHTARFDAYQGLALVGLQEKNRSSARTGLLRKNAKSALAEYERGRSTANKLIQVLDMPSDKQASFNDAIGWPNQATLEALSGYADGKNL